MEGTASNSILFLQLTLISIVYSLWFKAYHIKTVRVLRNRLVPASWLYIEASWSSQEVACQSHINVKKQSKYSALLTSLFYYIIDKGQNYSGENLGVK